MSKALSWSDIDHGEILGEGKAGVVRLGLLKKPYGSLTTGSSVAVKTYKSWVLEEPGQYERIVRELQTGRAIDHKNVVKILTMLRSPQGTPALVMKYYPGETLQTVLDRTRSTGNHISLDLSFQIIEGLASGILAIHEAGCVHRDIKPANVVLEGQSPIIMDFGVVWSSALPEQTTTGTFLGTLRYSAPEHIFGDACDRHGDIYSFGAIAYEIFGNELFLGEAVHWAKVVVEKSKRGFDAARPEFYQALERRANINTAEFVRFILESSVCSKRLRRLNLKNVVEACKQQLWREPFSTHDGTVSVGIAPDLFKWGRDVGLTVHQVAERIHSDYSFEQRQHLVRLLKDHYWWRHGFSVGSVFDEKLLQELAKSRAVSFEVDSGDATYDFHPAVRLSYRHGLIQ